MDAITAKVTAPRVGGAWIEVGQGSDRRYVFAYNRLNLRTPPGASVVVAIDPAGTHHIIGRDRG